MERGKTPIISIIMNDRLMPGMFYFLQRGFMADAGIGHSIGEFLRGRYKLSDDYISKRIGTVLFDGEPVDDIDSAILKDGSTVALSGAMPGLVGAVMRKGSYYASFRQSITHKENGDITRREGMIRIKLFNTVMRELGADFLSKGIYINSDELREFLSEQPEEFWRGCSEITLNRKSVEPALIKDGQLLSGNGLVFLTVKTPI